MVLLGDMGQVKARFGPFGDSVNVDAREVHGFAPNVCVKWKLVSDHLEIILMSTQERCTVCAKCTTGMKIFSGTPSGTSR
jgi:hypothetical protein